MTTEQVMEVMKEAMLVAFEMAGPLLILSIIVGLIVAVFQVFLFLLLFYFLTLLIC